MSIRRERIVYTNGAEAWIRCLTRYIVAPRDNTRFDDIHFHEHIELLFGLKGVARVLVGERSYTMEPGDLVIINSREAHDVIRESEECEYYVIQFLPSMLYSREGSLSNIRYLLPLWQKDVSFGPALRARELEKAGIGELFSEIMKEWREKPLGFESVIHANIMRIFVWVLRHRGISYENIPGVPEELRKILVGALAEAENHLESWSTKDAARACNLSYSYFSRNFKLVFGVSFSAYLESLRLREAERILLTTDRNITDVAESLGFGTTSYFIERFRKSYGMPPKVFRARMRENA